MDQFVKALSALVDQFKVNLVFLLVICLIVIGIHVINWCFRYRLNHFGILPRSVWGLPGIVFSPLLHGSFSHLFFNILPLFALANLVMLNGAHTFYCVTVTIVLVSGVAVWLFGRRAYHIGASSLIMGYFGYLLLNIYYHPSIVSILVGVVCLYYFGGMLANLFPSDVKVSWEGHVFGFIAGLGTVYLCPLLMPYF